MRNRNRPTASILVAYRLWSYMSRLSADRKQAMLGSLDPSRQQAVFGPNRLTMSEALVTVVPNRQRRLNTAQTRHDIIFPEPRRYPSPALEYSVDELQSLRAFIAIQSDIYSVLQQMYRARCPAGDLDLGERDHKFDFEDWVNRHGALSAEQHHIGQCVRHAGTATERQKEPL